MRTKSKIVASGIYDRFLKKKIRTNMCIYILTYVYIKKFMTAYCSQKYICSSVSRKKFLLSMGVQVLLLAMYVACNWQLFKCIYAKVCAHALLPPFNNTAGWVNMRCDDWRMLGCMEAKNMCWRVSCCTVTT